MKNNSVVRLFESGFYKLSAGVRGVSAVRARRVLEKYSSPVTVTAEKYCIYFVNPENGHRSDYMRNLPRDEAEQRVYGLRLLKLYPFMEKQEEEDGLDGVLCPLPGRQGT